jgi:MFS family permease
LLFTVYIVVLLATLLLFGSVSDYKGRRMVMLAGLPFGAVGCGLFLIADRVGLLFAARALQGVAVGLTSGAASAALLDLRPHGSAAPVVSSAAPTGGQALCAIGASVLAQYADGLWTDARELIDPGPPRRRLPRRPIWFGGCYSGLSSSAWSPYWRCQSPERCAPGL